MVIVGDQKKISKTSILELPAPTTRSPRVAKTANIAKMAEKCKNCINTRPTPPHTNHMELGPRNTF